MLIHQYKLFKMLPNESITSMFIRITIINSLDVLGRIYINVDIVSKSFRSSSKYQEAKVTTIQEAKISPKFHQKELIGLLMTHEITMEKQELEEKTKNNLAFKPFQKIMIVMHLSASSFILYFSGVIYCTKKNKYNILFIGKHENSINSKISTCPQSNITYYFRIILKIYSIKSLLDSSSRIIIS